MMKTRTAICGSLLALAAPALAQAPQAKVTPEAAAALTSMGAFLRGLESFTVDIDATTEDVLAGGQKLQFGNHVSYAVQRPDKLTADVSSDKVQRRFNYDGAVLTVQNGREGYYAQLPAKGSIAALLDQAYEKAGIDLPLQDLFRWGDASATTARPTEGFLVGAEKVGGIATNHYAFRQKGVDFQLWLDNSATPFPRKIVITNLADAAQPQYVANLNWNVAPKFAADQFTFKPGPDAKKIQFLNAAAKGAAK